MMIFTKGRRKYLSKRFGDFTGLILAATIASDIFAKFSPLTKIILILGGLALFVGGFICSVNEDEKGD